MREFDYIQPVFRPPSEANSLILQVTNGCSWNHCTFCEMYTEPQKQFRPKPIEQIREELKQFAASGYPVRRVFLADGDAMTLSFRRLRDRDGPGASDSEISVGFAQWRGNRRERSDHEKTET